METEYKQESHSGSKILLVDDNLEYLDAIQMLLQREGHEIITAPSGAEALDIAKNQTFDLVLVDYYMPAMTGEEFVRELRTFNEIVQVILQTGYASEQPPHELLRRLDIQGYFDKSEGPEKLLLWVEVGIKASKSTRIARNTAKNIDQNLQVLTDQHFIQPLDKLLEDTLIRVMDIVGVGNSFIAVFPETRLTDNGIDHHDGREPFPLVIDEKMTLMVQTGIGHFSQKKRIRTYLGDDDFAVINQTCTTGKTVAFKGRMVLPLKVADCILGIVYLDREISGEQDINLLAIFANQSAAAINNSRSCQVALNDPVTSIFSQGLFFQCILRGVRSAFLRDYSRVLLMVDMDNVKAISDQMGYLVGDQSLDFLNKCLEKASSISDIFGRYNEDEFVLPVSAQETDKIGGTGKKEKIYPVVNLPEDEIHKIINKINTIMENEKIYMDMGITLPDLAHKIGVKRNQLSFLLNKYFNTSFYDFINKYRINEAKKILAQNTNTRVNFLNIGMTVGYNSKTAFNVNFKKLTHMSPSEYREKYKCNIKRST